MKNTVVLKKKSAKEIQFDTIRIKPLLLYNLSEKSLRNGHYHCGYFCMLP